MDRAEILKIENKIQNVLRNIFDPEIPVNIYELGLIYEIKVSDDGKAKVLMTLTSPNCTVAESLPAQVKQEVEYLDGVTESVVEVTFEPPWSQDMMSEEAKLELGLL